MLACNPTLFPLLTNVTMGKEVFFFFSPSLLKDKKVKRIKGSYSNDFKREDNFTSFMDQRELLIHPFYYSGMDLNLKSC